MANLTELLETITGGHKERANKNKNKNKNMGQLLIPEGKE